MAPEKCPPGHGAAGADLQLTVQSCRQGRPRPASGRVSRVAPTAPWSAALPAVPAVSRRTTTAPSVGRRSRRFTSPRPRARRGTRRPGGSASLSSYAGPRPSTGCTNGRRGPAPETSCSSGAAQGWPSRGGYCSDADRPSPASGRIMSVRHFGPGPGFVAIGAPSRASGMPNALTRASAWGRTSSQRSFTAPRMAFALDPLT